jgi:hypothetical protein
MKKITTFFLLFFVSVISVPEEREAWTFSYFSPIRLSPSRLITAYPEFRGLLERIHGLINEGEYNTVSLLLRDKISSLNINTRYPDEFEKLVALIHIDAALDYFLRDNRQQGLNKQYIAFYISGRLYNNWQAHNEDALHQFFLSLGFPEDDILYSARFFPAFSPYSFSLTILKNSYFPDSFSRFTFFVEHLPVLHFHAFYDIFAFGSFISSFHSFHPFDPNEFADDFALLDFIVSFEGFDAVPPEPMIADKREIKDIIAQYWHEDDETRFFYSPEWDINAVLKTLAEDLFHMRDFSEDLSIFANPIFFEGARRAADAVNSRMPVTVFPITSFEERAGPTHELFVFATFRQARAEGFFNLYYGKEREP